MLVGPYGILNSYALRVNGSVQQTVSIPIYLFHLFLHHHCIFILLAYLS